MSSMEVSGRLLGNSTVGQKKILKRREEPRLVVKNDTYAWVDMRVRVSQIVAEAAKDRPKSLNDAIRKEIEKLGLEKSVTFKLDEYHRSLVFSVDMDKMPPKKKLQELNRKAPGLCDWYPSPECSYPGQIKIQFKLLV